METTIIQYTWLTSHLTPSKIETTSTTKNRREKLKWRKKNKISLHKVNRIVTLSPKSQVNRLAVRIRITMMSCNFHNVLRATRVTTILHDYPRVRILLRHIAMTREDTLLQTKRRKKREKRKIATKRQEFVTHSRIHAFAFFTFRLSSRDTANYYSIPFVSLCCCFFSHPSNGHWNVQKYTTNKCQPSCIGPKRNPISRRASRRLAVTHTRMASIYIYI